jgi:NAD(P)H-nitrite reductase large subunit
MALLCHCHVVGDRCIAAAVDDGCVTVEAVQQATGAGTSCGGCLAAVEELVDRLSSLDAAAAA